MAGEAFGLTPFKVASSGDCPDCDADTELTLDPEHPNVWRLQIAHDHTCPTFNQMRTNR